MSTGSMDNLINELTEDLTPVKPLWHPGLRFVPWALGSLVYSSGVIFYLGLRPDLVNKLADTAFLFEVITMIFVAATAGLASLWLSVPGMRGQRWIVSLPLTLVGVFVVWSGLRSMTEGLSMPALHWDHCFQDAALMGFVPAAVIMFLTLKGATTRPIMTAFMNVFAAGALGYVGLRFTCMIDTVGHAGLYHLFPFIVFGLALGAGARFIYRW